MAEFFEKEHKDIVHDTEKMLQPQSGLSVEFNALSFERISYTDSGGKKQIAYAMTRDGFAMLVMGYTGAKAMHFKELYIKRFNEMDTFIKTLVSARQEFPLLTKNIKLLHDSPKPYHFSNECDMLNRIVLVMTAKQYRLANGIEKGKSIRPYLTKDQINMIEILQKVDVGLLVAFPNFEDRKCRLEWYKSKIEEEL